MITNIYNYINKKVLLKRYILIFTLALISCAGTNYIHSLTNQGHLDNVETNDNLVIKKDVVGVKQDLGYVQINHLV
jgi:hypothetical protein